MDPQRLDRLQDFLRSQGMRAALLSSPFTITWLTGYAPPIQTGPSPFDGGPALGWLSDGALTLILSDGEAGAARASGVRVCEYAGFTVDSPLDCTERQAAAVTEVLSSHESLAGPVAAEMNFLPAPLLSAVQQALPRATLQPSDAALARLRAVKTRGEIEKIRAALRLCDRAQKEIQADLLPGVTEIELWGRMKARLEVAAGGRLPVLADLVAGGRTAEIGGLPGGYTLRPGDPVIFDVVPRLDGYWGDNCATYFVGDPGDELSRMHRVVRDALRRAIDAVRPGIKACELDQHSRRAIRDAGYSPYPHHTGHGLGTAYHEEPRVVPCSDMALEPGMVIALEPGIYVPEVGGVRLEDVVLVTPGGCEVLTQHLVGS